MKSLLISEWYYGFYSDNENNDIIIYIPMIFSEEEINLFLEFLLEPNDEMKNENIIKYFIIN